MMTKPYPEIVDKTNIEAETYYNLVQLCKFTKRTNPPGAARCGARFRVKRDENGNITDATEILE